MNAGTDFSLGILAGGHGRRWGGRDKGLIAFRGRPLLANACQPRPRQAREILICCRDNARFYAHYGDRVLCESAPHRGPCAGIGALLAACESETLIILPTDLLSASEPLIAALEHGWTEGDGAIVLTDEDGNHSPCIKIAKPMLKTCNAFLERGDNKLSGLLSALSAKAVPVTSFLLRDADRPADMPTQGEAR